MHCQNRTPTKSSYEAFRWAQLWVNFHAWRWMAMVACIWPFLLFFHVCKCTVLLQEWRSEAWAKSPAKPKQCGGKLNKISPPLTFSSNRSVAASIHDQSGLFTCFWIGCLVNSAVVRTVVLNLTVLIRESPSLYFLHNLKCREDRPLCWGQTLGSWPHLAMTCTFCASCFRSFAGGETCTQDQIPLHIDWPFETVEVRS